MDEYVYSGCPNCTCHGKTVRMDDEGKFYVECDTCGFTTPHFKFVVQAQSCWMVEGRNGSSMPMQA